MAYPCNTHPFYSSSTPSFYSTNTTHTLPIPTYPYYNPSFYSTTTTPITSPTPNLDFHHGYTPPSPNPCPSYVSHYTPYPSQHQTQPPPTNTYQHLPTPTISHPSAPQPNPYSSSSIYTTPYQQQHHPYLHSVQTDNPYTSTPYLPSFPSQHQSPPVPTLFVSNTYQHDAHHSNPDSPLPHSHSERSNQRTENFQLCIQKISQAFQRCKDELKAIDEKFQASQISVNTQFQERKKIFAEMSQNFRPKLQENDNEEQEEMDEKELKEQVCDESKADSIPLSMPPLARETPLEPHLPPEPPDPCLRSQIAVSQWHPQLSQMHTGEEREQTHATAQDYFLSPILSTVASSVRFTPSDQNHNCKNKSQPLVSNITSVPTLLSPYGFVFLAGSHSLHHIEFPPSDLNFSHQNKSQPLPKKHNPREPVSANESATRVKYFPKKHFMLSLQSSSVQQLCFPFTSTPGFLSLMQFIIALAVSYATHHYTTKIASLSNGFLENPPTPSVHYPTSQKLMPFNIPPNFMRQFLIFLWPNIILDTCSSFIFPESYHKPNFSIKGPSFKYLAINWPYLFFDSPSVLCIWLHSSTLTSFDEAIMRKRFKPTQFVNSMHDWDPGGKFLVFKVVHCSQLKQWDPGKKKSAQVLEP